MPLIYIDTNVFLGFYRSATDRLKVFQEIMERADQVVLTEQSINEFRRNRAACLSQLIRNIEEAAKINVFSAAVVRDLPQFANWDKAHKETKKYALEIVAQLKEWRSDEESDPVYKEFIELAGRARYLATKISAIEKAQQRKILGNPPTSPGKQTIGDELIWETLLDGCREDLIVVSRDQTFLDNQGLLKEEFSFAGRRELVLVTEHLSKALSAVGKPSKDISDAEKADTCPRCGGDLEEMGFDGADGDEAWWLFCTKCGDEYFPLLGTPRVTKVAQPAR